MQRYFVKSEQIKGNTVSIHGQDYHHIKNVMRMKTGDNVYICDQDENVYLANLVEIKDQEIILRLREKIDYQSELNCSLTIALGLTRREKQEEVLRRITELGADGFLTVSMARSIVKAKGNTEKIIERQKSIAKEASEQSQRRRIPQIFGNFSFEDFLKFSAKFDHKLFAYEEAGRKNDASLKKIIRSSQEKAVLVLVGPEGGISLKESEKLLVGGFSAVGLGPRILRCETAPLYIMSAFSYELELKDES